MRQLVVSHRRESAEQVCELAEEFEAKHLFQVESRRGRDGGYSTSFLHLQNRQVEAFLCRLDERIPADVTLLPHPVVTLHAPFGEKPDDATDPQKRSPFEVFQEGIQSIGSVAGLLGYSFLGGLLVWIGLYTNSVALQVAAMLIAPFAGPAMNFALGTARGDGKLIARSMARYVGALSVTVFVAYLLSTLSGQQHATSQMLFNGKVSSLVVLLPLISGTAGALNLIQSRRDSLVSGAAVGVLVAALLAPPAGNLGMALAIGAPTLAYNSLFLLVLQLLGINLAGALVFRCHGISSRQALYERGSSLVSAVAAFVTVAGLVAMLLFQFAFSPELQRSTLEQELVAQVYRPSPRELDACPPFAG